MMKPASRGRAESTILRSRLRSVSDAMRCETPTLSMVGMSTQCRPGRET
jgi:hypothetical protein